MTLIVNGEEIDFAEISPEILQNFLSSKQDKLTGSEGQVVGFDDMGLAYAVRGWSNPNLLLNWDFRNPVNRNGKMEYATYGYTIDCWELYLAGNNSIGSTVSLGSDGITITIGEATYGILQQTFNLDQVLGRTVTMSVLTSDELISGTVTLPTSISDTSIDTTNFIFSDGSLIIGFVDLFAIANMQNNNQISMRINVTKYHSIQIKAVKLELGSQQTLAHQDEDGSWVLNDPPNYDLQYALCSLYSPITGEWVGYQHSNPNLLDNWYFVDPVNQRGKTEYIESGYTIDRWMADGGLIVENGFIKIDSYKTFSQSFEGQEAMLGKTFTISILTADGELLTVSGTLPKTRPSTSTNYILSETGDISIFIRVSKETNTGGNFVSFKIINNRPTYIYILAAKVELGTQQTLAHKEGDTWVLNDPPPNKALELAKCQNYFERIHVHYGPYETGWSNGGEVMVVPIKYSTKRAAPTISFGGSNVGFQYVGNGSFAAVTYDGSRLRTTPNLATLSFTGASFPHLIPLNLVFVGDMYIDINADL